IDEIAAKIFNMAFLNAGQSCAALKRLYVHESQYEALSQKLADIANAQVVGDGMASSTTFGPVQNQMQYNKVKALIAEAIAAAQNPILMASAMKKAVEAGREAFLAGRMPRKRMANASSPETGYFFK
ncbi:aldehyde dehydrogenase family protein, partial [Acinetobacter baumannii]